MDERLRFEASFVDKASAPLGALQKKLNEVGASSGLRSVRADMDKLNKQWGTTSATVGSLAGGFASIGLGALTAGASVAAFVSSMRELGTNVLALRNLATQTGVAVNHLRQLEQVAARFQINPDLVKGAFAQVSRESVDLSRGVGSLFGELAQKNSAFAEQLRNDGRNVEAIVGHMLGFLQQIPDEEVRRQWSGKFFGSEDFARMFPHGDMQKFSQAMKETAGNGKIGDDLVAAAEKYAEATTKLNEAFESLKLQVGPAILNQLAIATDTLKGVIVGDPLKGTLDELREIGHWIESLGKRAGWTDDGTDLMDAKRRLGQFENAHHGKPLSAEDQAEKRAIEESIRRLQDKVQSGTKDGAKEGVRQGMQLFQQQSFGGDGGGPSLLHSISWGGGGGFGGGGGDGGYAGAGSAGGGGGYQPHPGHSRLPPHHIAALAGAVGALGSSPGLDNFGVDGVRPQGGGLGTISPGAVGGFRLPHDHPVVRGRRAMMARMAAMGGVSPGEGGALLDMVAAAEGTTKRGYNDAFGHQDHGDLSRYSLDQIMQLQRTQRGSSAIGRYQFMRATLAEEKRKLGLSGNEKFTPALQERLARSRLAMRGYAAWRSGKLSDRDFLHNMAHEWAGLTSPKTGHGIYPGQDTGFSVAREYEAARQEAARRTNGRAGDHASIGLPNRYVNGVYHSDLHGVPMPANMPPPAPPVLYDYLRNEHKAEEQRLKVMGAADLHIRVSGSGGAAGRVVSSSASGLIRRINIPRGSTMPTPSSDA